MARMPCCHTTAEPTIALRAHRHAVQQLHQLRVRRCRQALLLVRHGLQALQGLQAQMHGARVQARVMAGGRKGVWACTRACAACCRVLPCSRGQCLRERVRALGELPVLFCGGPLCFACLA